MGYGDRAAGTSRRCCCPCEGGSSLARRRHHADHKGERKSGRCRDRRRRCYATLRSGLRGGTRIADIGRVARGSLKNKILFLLPSALLLSAFTPRAITPLLMIGGLFLCFEGYEKVQQMMAPHNAHANATDAASPALDPRAVEEKTVAGRTDFILSAEISPFVLLTRSPVSRPGRRSYLDDSSGSRSGECPAGSPRSTTTEAPGRTCASTMGSIVGIANASGSVPFRCQLCRTTSWQRLRSWGPRLRVHERQVMPC